MRGTYSRTWTSQQTAYVGSEHARNIGLWHGLLWDGDPGSMCTRVVQLGNYGRRRPRKGERFITFLEAVATPKGVATPLFDECIGEFPLL